jgi:hypothetical protein
VRTVGGPTAQCQEDTVWMSHDGVAWSADAQGLCVLPVKVWAVVQQRRCGVAYVADAVQAVTVTASLRWTASEWIVGVNCLLHVLDGSSCCFCTGAAPLRIMPCTLSHAELSGFESPNTCQ